MKKLAFLFGLFFCTNTLIFTQTWIQQTSGTIRTLLAVSFIDANNGLATGNNSTILKTTNGGQDWLSQSLPLYPEPLNVKYINTNVATLTGQDGKIFRTTDGGANWVAQTSGTTQPLRGIDFVDVNNGWIVGQQGVILRTTNGGTNWTQQNSGVSVPLWCVDFTDINTGTATGGNFPNGVILRTSDGGQSWTQQTNNSQYTLYGVSFTSSSVGYAVADFGTILKTINGGQNWVKLTPPITASFRGISFCNEKNGVIVEISGIIIRTTDGGQNWIQDNSGITLPLFGISMVNANLAWAVGGSGTILKYGTGSSSSSITVTAPNGGENVTVGSTATINWTSSNVANVKIEYTTDNGSTWQTIISSYSASSGIYSITIPNTPSTQCKVKISDASNASINDMSDNVFTISTGTSSGGLIAYYPFNGNANDESGNGRNGVVYGATLTTDRFGNPDKAYQFNGISNYIDIPGTNNLHLNTGGLTLAAWINFTESNEIHAIVGKHIAGYGNGYYITVRPATKIEFLVDSEYGLRSNDSYNDGAWHFVVGTFDGSTMKLYLDGELKSSQTKTYSSLNDSTITIGKHHAGVATNFFNGKIDDIRIFDKAISETEVLQLFNDGTNLNQGLVAHYPFNSNANDESGNNRNGLNYGATLTTDRFGNPDKAYQFNGTSNYIDIPGTNNLHLNTGGLTLAAWINFTESNEMHAIIGKHISGYGNGYYLMIRPATNVEFYTDSEYGLRSSEAINDGNWHFLTGVYDGSTMKLYMDGVLKSSQNKSYTNLNDSTIMIGKHHAGATTNFFNGKIDDIKIYNRPLTDLEILVLNTENPVGIKDEKSKTPNSFSLEQNYPNPFNPNTKINYTIQKESYIKLSVFNLLGEIVAMPVNEIKQAGNYAIDFNAGNLNSGIYFYRIETAGFMQAKKMLLLK